jgi:O-antigen/teichoic acid export membrane protein
MQPESPRGRDPGLRVRASRGTLLSLGGQIAAQLLRLAGNLVLTRLLLPEAFGLIALAFLVLFVIDQISNLGIPAAIMRLERGEEPEFLDTAWTLQIGRGLGLWAVASALAPAMAHFYDEPQLVSILPVASFAAVLTGLSSTKLLLLTRRLDLGRRVAIEICGQAAAVVAMIALAWWHRSVWALVIGGLANPATVAALSHVWIPGRSDRLRWNAEAARQLVSFGKWVFASSGFSIVQAQMDIAMLGRLLPAATLGVYSLGTMIPNLMRDVLFRLSSSVLAPAFAESSRHSHDAFRTRYVAARRMMLPVALLCALATAVVGPAFFHYLYDERYADAGWITQLVAIRFWFAYLQVAGCLTLLAMGDGRPWAISSATGVVTVAAGCWIGFQQGGLAGAILGVALGNAITVVVPALWLWRLGVASPLAELGYTLLGAALAGLGAALLELPAPTRWIPDPSLRTLVLGGTLLAPFALWAALRIRREIRV